MVKTIFAMRKVEKRMKFNKAVLMNMDGYVIMGTAYLNASCLSTFLHYRELFNHRS